MEKLFINSFRTIENDFENFLKLQGNGGKNEI